MRKVLTHIVLINMLVVFAASGFAQISPGELSKAHSHLEGLSNCTKCHVLGEKETTSKCLDCHKEIKNLINEKKGYHASSEVAGKKCAECHGEHFGVDFQLVRFDQNSFDHKLSGYQLEGKHAELKCVDCHKTELIPTKISQKKGSSYLGLGTECLSCHEDFHQGTLNQNCTSCHNQNKFDPATFFDHAKTEFSLIGKHQTVDCAKCHKTIQRNNKDFIQFANVEHSNCTSCHVDVHNNKFGNDCRKCHSEYSFHEENTLSSFNHDKTNYPLQGKHVDVDCKKCHTKSYTVAVKHTKCTDCHTDYHEGQLSKNGINPDCAECHSVNGFVTSTYGLEKHNLSQFPLEGAHMATPCFSCHKKTQKWNFSTGTHCVDCHENIHKEYISEKYYPEQNCKNCHNSEQWKAITFEHKQTGYELLGKHAEKSCRDCHFNPENENGKPQQFQWESQLCTNCHTDVHHAQFAINEVTRCDRCHANSDWKAEKFNHNQARFKLDGKHEGLACVQCHKPKSNSPNEYVVYKFEDITCKSCH